MRDPFANMDESVKHLVDGVSIMATLGTLVEMLPSISALLSIIWVGIRIWETDTVKGLTGRKGGSDAVDQ